MIKLKPVRDRVPWNRPAETHVSRALAGALKRAIAGISNPAVASGDGRLDRDHEAGGERSANSRMEEVGDIGRFVDPAADPVGGGRSRGRDVWRCAAGFLVGVATDLVVSYGGA